MDDQQAATKWEYFVYPLPFRQRGLRARLSWRRRARKQEDVQEVLNNRGAEGWELVHVEYQLSPYVWAIFKRPRAEEDR